MPRCCPQLLIPPRSFHPRRHLNEKRHPLTTISVWLRGKSLLGKHLIRQAASFINVFPAGVKAPKMTSVHNKTFFSHFKLLYLWVYSDLNDTRLNSDVQISPDSSLNTSNTKRVHFIKRSIFTTNSTNLG